MLYFPALNYDFEIGRADIKRHYWPGVSPVVPHLENREDRKGYTYFKPCASNAGELEKGTHNFTCDTTARDLVIRGTNETFLTYRLTLCDVEIWAYKVEETYGKLGRKTNETIS